jgi:hypothetical protein
VAAMAFTLVAASMPQASAAEFPAGFQASPQIPESYHLTVGLMEFLSGGSSGQTTMTLSAPARLQELTVRRQR